MFIIIDEFNGIYKTEEVPEEIYLAVEDGIYDLIDISDPNHPKQYNGSVWVELENLGTPN
jgi:hypothetical protein